MRKQKLYPDVEVYEGRAIFSSNDIRRESIFKLLVFPNTFRIIADFRAEMEFMTTSYWRLDGLLNDEKEIGCKKMLLINGSESVSFLPNDDLIIGSPNYRQISKVDFDLTGFHVGKVNMVWNGNQIRISNNSDHKQLEQLSKIWNVQLKGSLLQLQIESGSIEDYRGLANDIRALLSLASGNDVIYNHYSVFTEDGNRIEYYRGQKGDDFGSHSCIPESLFKIYLDCTLSIWDRLGSEEKKVYRNAINYINSTTQGYLEDRVLRIAQAWESLANHFCEKPELPKEVEELKTKLKKVYKEWNKANKTYDPDGFFGSRLSEAFDWERTLLIVTRLAEIYNLNIDEIGLDFKKLFRLRHSVAHHGRFIEKEDKGVVLDVIETSVLGLQYLILAGLGYKDKVIGKEHTPENISVYLID